jgi:DNA adenine methylase
MEQLALDIPNCRKANPPRGQLLKWIGNKQRFAAEIASYFPRSYGTYFEPFLGTGAVLAAVAPPKAVASDIFPPLIEIWNALKKSPEVLKEWYAERWRRFVGGDKATEYENIKSGYNRSPNGADLLFISRSCYGGVVRFRKADGHISTPVGAHDPIRPESFARRVDEWSKRVTGTDFFALDFREATARAKRGDLVYCDPPYHHSQGILYGAQSFKVGDLFDAIAHCQARGVFVALSIDGIKKSGTLNCDVNIPAGLFRREAFVDCGRSMLRRFQMGGRTLESEVVHDRLLLTY